MREITSIVVSCRISQAPPQPKRGKKDKSVPTEPPVEVILHDTVLFPEGGGQPSDIGTLTSSDGHLWDVLEVKRLGGHAVHYVKAGELTTEDALSAFAVGSTVGVALGKAGLDRRLDHVRSSHFAKGVG